MVSSLMIHGKNFSPGILSKIFVLVTATKVIFNPGEASNGIKNPSFSLSGREPKCSIGCIDYRDTRSKMFFVNSRISFQKKIAPKHLTTMYYFVFAIALTRRTKKNSRLQRVHLSTKDVLNKVIINSKINQTLPQLLRYPPYCGKVSLRIEESFLQFFFTLTGIKR